MKNYFLSKRWFLLRLFVIRRRIQFQQTCRIFCVKNLNNSCLDLKKDRKVKIVQKNQIVVLETQNKILTTVRTKNCEKSNFFPLHSKSHNDTRNMFSWNNCYFFKTSPSTSRMQPRRTCRTFPPNVRQSFVYTPNITKNCYTLQPKSNFSSNFRLYTWNAFLTNVPKLLSWMWKNFILKSRNWWENSKLLEKMSKWSSRFWKRSLVNGEQKRLFLVKLFSHLSFKNIWKI